MKTRINKKITPLVKTIILVIAVPLLFLIVYNLVGEAQVGGFGPNIRYKVSKLVDRFENQFMSETTPNFEFLSEDEESFIVFDLARKEVIDESHSEVLVPPASLTKLLTASVVLDYMSSDEKILVEQESLSFVKEDASVSGIVPGEYTVLDLLKAMLIPSGNDAAYALAVGAGRKINGESTTEQAYTTFQNAMNKWIQDNGLESTVISDPSGHAQKDQINAKDALTLAIKALEHPEIDAIVQKQKDEIDTSNGTLTLVSTNRYMDPSAGSIYDSRVSGVKTGSLDNVYNEILRYEGIDTPYITVVLGGKTREEKEGTSSMLLYILEHAREDSIVTIIENFLHGGGK